MSRMGLGDKDAATAFEGQQQQRPSEQTKSLEQSEDHSDSD